MKTLVLNAGYEPLSVVSFRRAIVLVLSGKATVVADEPVPVRAQTLQMNSPSVIVLTTYVTPPRRRRVAVSRRGVLRRDRHRCGYCGGYANTIDHVLPRSRGGQNTWENLVACCRECNNRKGDHTPAEMGWRLRVTPTQPRTSTWFIPDSEKYEPQWAEFLSYARVA